MGYIIHYMIDDSITPTLSDLVTIQLSLIDTCDTISINDNLNLDNIIETILSDIDNNSIKLNISNNNEELISNIENQISRIRNFNNNQTLLRSISKSRDDILSIKARSNKLIETSELIGRFKIDSILRY